MRGQEALMSSARDGKGADDWCTPEKVLDLVRAVAPIQMDPCTGLSNNVGAELYYTEQGDGLTADWPGRGLVYINPPYSRMADWATKIASEVRGVKREMIALLPARTDTRWWHTLVGSRPHRICFWKGRVKFNRPDGTPGQAAPFPSALLYWGADDDTFARVFSPHGWIVRT